MPDSHPTRSWCVAQFLFEHLRRRGPSIKGPVLIDYLGNGSNGQSVIVMWQLFARVWHGDWFPSTPAPEQIRKLTFSCALISRGLGSWNSVPEPGLIRRVCYQSAFWEGPLPGQNELQKCRPSRFHENPCLLMKMWHIKRIESVDAADAEINANNTIRIQECLLTSYRLIFITLHRGECEIVGVFTIPNPMENLFDSVSSPIPSQHLLVLFDDSIHTALTSAQSRIRCPGPGQGAPPRRWEVFVFVAIKYLKGSWLLPILTFINIPQFVVRLRPSDVMLMEKGFRCGNEHVSVRWIAFDCFICCFRPLEGVASVFWLCNMVFL